MRKPFLRRKGLQEKLTLYALTALALALCVFLLAQAVAELLLGGLAETAALEVRARDAVARRVQDYVTKRHISTRDLQALNEVQGISGYVILSVYKDGTLLYDSLGGDIAVEQAPDDLYPLTLADADASFYIWDCGFYTLYYRIAAVIGAALAFLAFSLLFVRLIRRKLRYIVQLGRELAILEGGELDCPITVEGDDELGALAQSIDDMRRSFIERQRGEAEAIRANQALISAMSHDLRTPLMSLMGYIELMQNGQYASEEQLAHFIRASRDKVLRIKEMTDTLFAYAVCGGEESEAVLETLDAYELFAQLMGEHSFELEGAGFKTTLVGAPFRAGVQADPAQLLRVFDNLTSNIKKDGDPSTPVCMELTQEGVWISVRVSNRVRAQSLAESNRIGLKTCERILREHHGKFRATRGGERFTVTLTLPVWDEGAPAS